MGSLPFPRLFAMEPRQDAETSVSTYSKQEMCRPVCDSLRKQNVMGLARGPCMKEAKGEGKRCLRASDLGDLIETGSDEDPGQPEAR